MSDSVLLRCDVADTGIGIEAEKQTLIFEAFTQSDTSTTRHYGGTGLGLTICARLIEMMGGAIWVKSELGRGSTFSFTARFGFVPLQEEASPTLNLEALRDLPVLIVDDNATNRKILEGMLHHWNTAPSSVSSAAEALAVLRERHTRGTPFRLVLTDVNMPGVDGFMLCEQIRGIPELADLILVVLTSGDRAGDHSLYKQLGVATHLLKPVKPSELLRVVLRVLGKAVDRQVTDTGRLEPAAESLTKSLRVLLAEDSVVNQKLAVGLLNKWGHTVHTVATGLAAVEAWQRETFDLILMDVQMPTMNGLEATAAIRQHEARTGGHIPIIALTAHALEGDRNQCLSAGMDDYVPKPLRHQDLRRAIVNSCFDTEEKHSDRSGTVDQ